MTHVGKKPRYDEGCLGAHALNVVGDRWALLVVRELMFTPKRFQMLRAGLPGITASVLTQRLAELRDSGVLTHDPKLGIYALTAMGQRLMPVLEALCVWALGVPGHDPTRFISPTSLMISMRVGLTEGRARGKVALAGFDFGSECFEVALRDGALQTKAVAVPETPFVLKGNGSSMAFTIYGTAPLSAMIAKGFARATGDLAAAQDFIDLFRLEKPA